MLGKVSSYLKNVGKSLAYATSDIVKEDASTLYSTYDTNKEVFKNVYDSVRNYKTTVRKLDSLFKSSKIYVAADIGMKAIFEDLRNGTFYNKAREEEIQMKLGGFDMSDDFDIDEFEKSIKDNKDISAGDKAVVDSITKSTRLSGELVSDTIARTSAASIAANEASTRLLYTQNVQMLSGIQATVDTLNGVGRTINGTNSMLKTMADNQKMFYENTTKKINEMHAFMHEMVDMQRNLYNEQRNTQQKNQKKRQSYSDIIDSDGVLDIREYGKNVKGNIKRKISEMGMSALFDDFGDGGNMLAQFAAAPLKFIPQAIMKSVIPEATRVATKSLNDTISGLFSTLVARLNNAANDDRSSPLTKIIGELLGIKVRKKATIETGKYNKGPVPFDGIVRKSIVDVIPGYLRRIESAITGQRGRTFDYDSGKWIELNKVREDYDKMYKEFASTALSDLRGLWDQMFAGVKADTKQRQDKFNEDRDTMFRYLTEHNGDWTRFTKSGADYQKALARELGVDPEMIKVMKGFLDRIEKLSPKEGRRAKTRAAGDAFTAIEQFTRRMEALEERGGTTLTAVEDSFNDFQFNKDGSPKKGTLGAGLLKVKDQYQKDIFDYLRSIDDTGKWIMKFYEMNRGRMRSSGGSGGHGQMSLPNMADIQAMRGTPDLTITEEIAKRKRAEADSYEARIKDSDTVFNDTKENWAADVLTRADINAENADIKRRRNKKQPTLFQDLMGINPDKPSYEGKFIDALRRADTLGAKYEVVQQALGKLAEAPMTMLTKVIEKADQSVYRFMFGDEHDAVDEDGNPINGLMAKMSHEIKLFFKNINETINTKILDPVKAQFEKWGIHNLTDALDKITGGRYSDAKEAIATTVLGAKDSEGKRSGGLADPFRKAFSYNWEKAWEHEKQNAREKARKEAEAEARAEDEYNSVNATAYGTAGRTVTPLTTMLSEGEYVTTPGGRRTRVSKSDELTPHTLPAGSIVENPAGASKRAQQYQNELINKYNWIHSNAEANDGTGITWHEWEKYNFKSLDEKLNFVRICAETEQIFTSIINTAGNDHTVLVYTKWYDEYWAQRTAIYNKLIYPASEKAYNKAMMAAGKKFIKYVTDLHKKLINNELMDEETKKEIDAANAGDAQTKQLNEGLHKFLDKWDYSKEENRGKIEKVADTTAKGAIGAGAGLLLGNPILGAVIGTITGIAKNNQAVHEFLFGKDGEDTGLISKKTQEYLSKAMPDVKKFGAIGSVAGLLTGLGPIPGLLLGSATAFAANNEELMTTLFGPEEERKKKMEKFKQALPRAGVGAAAGALLGPFGLLGGAALGAAGGLFTTTDTFKDLMFGEEDENGERKGGIVGSLKETFVDPLKDWAKDIKERTKEFFRDQVITPIASAIKPLATAGKNLAKSALTFVPKMINAVFENALGIPLGDFLRDKVLGPAAKVAKGILTFPVTLLKGAISLPAKAIGAIGNRVRESQIRRGTADYMSAEERLAYRDQHGSRFRRSILHPFRKDQMRSTDEILAGMDKGEIDSMLTNMDTVLDTESSLNKAIRKAHREMATFVDDQFHDKLIGGTKTKILKAIEKGNIDEAISIVGRAKNKDGTKIAGAELESFRQGILERYRSLKELEERRKTLKTRKRNSPGALKQAQDMLRSKGFKNVDLKSRSGMEKFRNILAQEKKAKSNILDDDLHTAGANLEHRQTALNSKIVEVVANLASVSQQMLDAANAYRADPNAYNSISKGMQGVYTELDELSNDPEISDSMKQMNDTILRGTKARTFKDNANLRIANKVMDKTAKTENSLLAKRCKLVKDADMVPKVTDAWRLDQPNINRIFNLIKRGSTFEVNTALDYVQKSKYFADRLAVALETTTHFIDAERLDIIYNMQNSKTKFDALKLARDKGIRLFDSEQYEIDHINTILGIGKAQLETDTIGKVFKLIADWTAKMGYPPKAGTILLWFQNYIEAQKAMATVYKKEQPEGKKERFTGIKNLFKRAKQSITGIDAADSYQGDDIRTNANADDGLEPITDAAPTLGLRALMQKNKIIKRRNKLHDRGLKLATSLANNGSEASDIFKIVEHMGVTLEEIKGINSQTAENTEETSELSKEQKKALKKKEKEDKRIRRLKRGNILERADQDVRAFGDKVAEGGNNFMTWLTHPIKMSKAAYHGSKAAYEGKIAEGKSANIIDILQGIRTGQKDQIKAIQDQQFEEGKTPIWKRLLQAVFGKTLMGFALKTVGVPLAVGLVKNYAWPWIKKTAWPWMREKLLGDPNVEGDGLLGRLHMWFKDKVVPFIFGEKNDEGVWTKGLFSGIANFWDQKVHPFLFGTKDADGNITEKGIFGKIHDWILDVGGWIGDGAKLIFSWLTNTNYKSPRFGYFNFGADDQGSSGFLATLVYNWADGLGTMVPFITKVFVKSIPTILKGLLTGVVEGVTQWLHITPSEAIDKNVNQSLINNYANSLTKNFKVSSPVSGLKKLVNFSGGDVESGSSSSDASSSSNASGSGSASTTPSASSNTTGSAIIDEMTAGTVKETISHSDEGISLSKYGVDEVVSQAEYDQHYSWLESVDDIELEEAIKLAEENLVILPAAMFSDKESYRAYYDGMFGEGALERHGWDLVSAITDPTIVFMNSGVYETIKNARTNGEIVTEATIKYLLSAMRGGVAAKVVPALWRASSNTLTIIAKAGSLAKKIPFIGKGVKGAITLATLPAHAGSFVGNITGGVSDTAKVAAHYAAEARAVGGFTSKEIGQYVAAELKDIDNMAAAASNVSKVANASDNVAEAVIKAPPWAQELGTRVAMAVEKFKDSPLIGKLAGILNKPKAALQKMITSTKAYQIGQKFTTWVWTKFPRLAEKFDRLVASGALKSIGAVLLLITGSIDIMMGAFDAKTILGLRDDRNLTELDYFLATLVNLFANQVLCGLIPACDIVGFVNEHIVLGLWPDIESDYIKGWQSVENEYQRYLSDHGYEQQDFTKEQFLDTFYPSAQSLMEKDFNEGNYKNLADSFKRGYGISVEDTSNPIGQFFAAMAENWAGGMNMLFGHGKKDKFGTGKDHIDQRSSSMRYNAPGDSIYQTVADSGCGPAAAATVISQYGRGKLEEAAKYSLANGYKEPNGGTYPGFFGDYLGTKGIGTQYETTSEGVMNSLAQGKPVIMMGTGGGSTASPYDGASGSHYVTATGLDRHGNMIIEDPDSRTGHMAYSPSSVLNRTSIAISTHPGKGKRRYGTSKLPKLKPMGHVFGRGTYTIDQMDKDGLQDMRVWKDPGDDKTGYIKKIEERIKRAARSFTDGIIYKHPDKVATAAVEAGISTGIDPALMLAIGMFESGFGTTPTARNKLNFWGYNYNNVTWEDGASDFSNGTHGDLSQLNYAFEQWAIRIRDNYYNAGQRCLYQMYNNGGKHQYSGEVDDITTDWVVNVAYYMKAIHDAVGQNANNLSIHNEDGSVVLLKDLTGAFYKTLEGYTGAATTQAISSDPNQTFSYNNGNDSGSSNKSESLLSMFTSWGKKLLKSTFGGLYDLLFGSSDDDSSTYSGNAPQHLSKGGFYDENGNWVSGDLQSENATTWFEKTLKGSHVSFPYDGYRSSITSENGGTITGYHHKGIDFATAAGTPIYSPVDGVVKLKNTNTSHDFGNYVKLEDLYNDSYKHIFAHMSAHNPELYEGQTITRGTLIGKVGSTGFSEGPHLHYEIDNTDKPKDPNLLYSINPDTEFNWYRYQEHKSDKEKAEEKYDAMSTDELLEQMRLYKATYDHRDKLPSSEKAKVEANYELIRDALRRRWEHEGQYHPSLNSDGTPKINSGTDQKNWEIYSKLKDRLEDIYLSGKFGPWNLTDEERDMISDLTNLPADEMIRRYASPGASLDKNKRPILAKELYRYAKNYSDTIYDHLDDNEYPKSVLDKFSDRLNTIYSAFANGNANQKNEAYAEDIYNYSDGTVTSIPYGQFGTGKSIAQKQTQQMREMQNILNMGSQLQKNRNAKGNASMSSQTSNLVAKTKAYVQKYKVSPFAVETDSAGKGKSRLPKLSVKKYGTATTVTNSNTSGNLDTSTINYTRMFITVIEVLSKIADNTDKLDRIIELLRKYGPSFGVDTSGLGRGKTNAETAHTIKATIANHKTDPSWAFSAMNHMNDEAASDTFMESVLSLARE